MLTSTTPGRTGSAEDTSRLLREVTEMRITLARRDAEIEHLQAQLTRALAAGMDADAGLPAPAGSQVREVASCNMLC